MTKGGSDIPPPDPKAAASVDSSLEGGSTCSTRDADRTIAKLREALRTRDEFIAFAAHELRNPITPIGLCVRLIRDAGKSGDRTRLSSELTRLDRLLNRFLRRTELLLEITQLISGRPRLEPVETSLSELANGVIDDIDPLLMRSGSRLTANLAPDMVGFVDPAVFTQIFENLLSNAIKYGLGKPIEVSLRLCDGDALLVVRDHGVGICRADRARIFEPFERAVKSDNRPGFGLGLWVVRRLAEAMGGSITVSSQKGAGSIFMVRLPLSPQETDE